MIKHFGNRIITTVDATVDDEYERSVLHRSASIYARMIIWSTFVLMMVLAWVLPGWHSLWAAALIIPLLISEGVAQAWMRAHVAAPRPYRLDAQAVIGLIVVVIVMAAGIAYNTADAAGSFGPGVLIGGAVGVVAGLIIVPWAMRRARSRDNERFAHHAED